MNPTNRRLNLPVAFLVTFGVVALWVVWWWVAPVIGQWAFGDRKDAGIAGDMFGALSSLFGALTVVGIVMTFLEERKHRQELEIEAAKRQSERDDQLRRENSNRSLQVFFNSISNLSGMIENSFHATYYNGNAIEFRGRFAIAKVAEACRAIIVVSQMEENYALFSDEREKVISKHSHVIYPLLNSVHFCIECAKRLDEGVDRDLAVMSLNAVISTNECSIIGACCLTTSPILQREAIVEFCVLRNLLISDAYGYALVCEKYKELDRQKVLFSLEVK